MDGGTGVGFAGTGTSRGGCDTGQRASQVDSEVPWEIASLIGAVCRTGGRAGSIGEGRPGSSGVSWMRRRRNQHLQGARVAGVPEIVAVVSSSEAEDPKLSVRQMLSQPDGWKR